jgi:hypothetical protein
MAKRVRGTRTRPGQRPPLARGASRRPSRPEARPEARPEVRPEAGASGPASPIDAALPRPATLTDEEEARAAELEARIVAAERAAEAAATLGRRRLDRSTDGEGRARPGSIGVRAAEEYAYVSRDVRRIVLIGGSLVGTLIGLWVVTQATGASLF